MGNSDSSSQGEIKLIDLGFNSSYLTSDGKHIEEHLKYSKGNMAFTSGHKMIGVVPSRRDDFISLVYVLLYMLTGSLKFLSINIKSDNFEKISYQKHIATASSICSSEKCSPFYEFVKEVLSIKFGD